MKKLRRFLAFVLCAALCFLLLTGCGSRDTIRFKMIAELNQEEFCVAFRKGDPLCDIFTAALKELSADGQISRLSAQYLGTDYTCMEALPGALQLLETQPEPGRKLRIGVQDGIAPISSSRDDGSFGGLIPDLAQLVAEKLGWTFEYMVINSDNVAAELGSGNIDCAWMAASFSGSSSSVSLSPGWLRNTHELVVRSDSRYTRKNSLKGKVVGITDATALAALKESGMDAKVGSVWYYDDLSACFAALAAGDEIHVHFARGFGHQVDQLTINRAGCKLLFDFAVDFVVKPELIARASLLDDGQQRVGRRFTAVEELGVDIERPELSGRIPERMTFGADADGVGFKQPRYDGILHG